MNSRSGHHQQQQRSVNAGGLLGDIESLQAALGEEIKNLKLSQNLNSIAHKTLEKARQVLIKNANGYKELETNYMRVKSENETLRHRIGKYSALDFRLWMGWRKKNCLLRGDLGAVRELMNIDAVF
jgi:hypothetical protein